MYRLEVTIYEVGEQDSVAAVLHEGDSPLNRPLVSLRTELEPIGRETEGRHDRMIAQLHTICDRIAEELAEPLF